MTFEESLDRFRDGGGIIFVEPAFSEGCFLEVEDYMQSMAESILSLIFEGPIFSQSVLEDLEGKGKCSMIIFFPGWKNCKPLNAELISFHGIDETVHAYIDPNWVRIFMEEKALVYYAKPDPREAWQETKLFLKPASKRVASIASRSLPKIELFEM